jgi:hypothetical protein
MGYELNALFGKTQALSKLKFPSKPIQLATLSQGFSLLPIPETDEEIDGFSRIYFADSDDVLFLEEGIIPVPIYNSLLNISNGGKFAFLSAYFSGGTGKQYSVIWENGKVIKEFPITWNDDVDSWEKMPINQALKLLGVLREGEYDEFDTMRLSRFSETYDWYQSSLKSQD